MPRGHEYHQPNAPDAIPEELDSDLELDVDELGPSDRDGGYAGLEQGDGSASRANVQNEIPLQTFRNASIGAPGRRPKRFQDDDDAGALNPGSQEIGLSREDSSAGINVGDSTPLLHGEEDGESTGAHPSSRTFAGRMGLSGLRSRRDGYQNIGDLSQSTEETGKSAPRSINIGQYPPPRFPPNAISNAKYTPWSFLPRTLYNEFSFFINLYFLIVALSQVIPPLRIGVLWTYMAPLGFVLAVTLGKEAYDDVIRRRRDAEANRELYTMLRLRGPIAGSKNKKTNPKKPRNRKNQATLPGRLDAIEEEEEDTGGPFIEVDEMRVKAKDIKVGDVLKLSKNERVPADVVILKSYTAESSVIPLAPQAASPPKQPQLLFDQGQDDIASEPAAAKIPTPNQPSTSNSSDGGGAGETFIRTDQLDGETDWKLRIASPLTQSIHPTEFVRLTIIASKPSKKVNEFIGRMELAPKGEIRHEQENVDGDPGIQSVPLSIDNTAWANTVLASNAIVLAAVVYTGAQTRQALSTAPSRSKVGLLELEINNLTKILCIFTLTLAGALVGLQAYYQQLHQPWYVSVCRFLILFSSIIPISIRVNLDIGKSVYAYNIQHDKDMPEAVVRTSTIPEDLGRIEYLLSDKTGTLTQNEMDLRKVHVGTVSYANEAMEEVSSYVRQGFGSPISTDSTQNAQLVTPSSLLSASSNAGQGTRTRREIGSRVRDIVLALALCHNVTPTTEEENGHSFTTYQASSPDEIAIVRWTESVGLRLVHRDRHNIALQSVDSSRIVVRVRILDVFPFTSESKRMGIILQYYQGSESGLSSSTEPSEIWFYQKGADTVMTKIVAANDWLDEETANMAREGLRTLVVGRRKLSTQQYADFTSAYKEASLSLTDRDASMAHVVGQYLERNLELLGVTGVEDRLQHHVKPSLELLRNAGVKIWMLTGDKVETARCVAVSSKLVSRSQHIHTITSLEKTVSANPTAVSDTLSLLAANPDSTALLIDGDSLSYLLTNHKQAFISLAVLLPAVIACRCSPTQKMDVALLIRQHTKKRVACIGDGGNDVSMIQAADVGVGIVGKEGRQASLAADFSITQFHHLTKLLVWHGRNSYKRSAKLGQFIIHRGLVISVAQAIFSIAAHFQPDALFRDWLIVGYATMYTQLPIFSLVLDRDVDEALANLYPELYKELKTGRSLSYRSFLVWVLVSTWQGCAIQLLTQFLTGRVEAPPLPSPSTNATATPGGPGPVLADPSMAALSFSVLILNELLMAAIEVTTWHWAMIAAIILTFLLYAGSVPALGAYFNLKFILSAGFWWRLVAITAVAVVPVWLVRFLGRRLRPANYRKVRGV